MKNCNHPTCEGACRKVREKKPRKPLKRTVRIAPRSKKMVRAMEIYNRRRKAFLKANPVCAVTGQPATEVHHKAGRIGPLLLDESLWLPVSRWAHRMIEENPEWAKENGYSVSRLNKRA